MVIGRNNFNTAIEKVEVSRELLQLEWRDGTLFVVPLKEKHFAQVHNEIISEEREVNHGEIISLYKEKYSYQVRYAEASNKASELSGDDKRRLTDHLACPICMELLVNPIIAVPCGHRFCKSCCAGPECATCRAVIQSKIPDRLVEGLLVDLVNTRCLDTDDSGMYLQRTGKAVSSCLQFLPLLCCRGIC